MKDIYIVMTKSHTLVSRIIDLLMPTEYTHASISFDRDFDEMYSVGRKYGYSFIPACLNRETLDSSFYRCFRKSTIGVYSLQVSDKSYKAMKEYVDLLYSRPVKIQYSLLGLIYCRLRMSVIRKNKMFCSQFVCSVLNKAEEKLIDVSPELCTPIDIMNIKDLKLHYKGMVCDLAQMKKNGDLDSVYNQ